MGDRYTDSEVGVYLYDRDITDDYRDAVRPEEWDVYKTCAEMDIGGDYRGEEDGPLINSNRG